MADFSLESCTNVWWPANLKLLELEYENSKFLVQQDGLMSQKWKADIDLLINEEKLYRESQTCEQLSQTSKEQIQLLQNELRSLEKELKESKELLCQANESLKDAREENKLEKEELEERLTLEAEEKFAKEKEEFEKERNALKNEIEKWKNMKEKLGEEMKEMEKTLRTEADEKIKQQEKEAKNEIESLNEQIKNWQDRHMKAVQEVEDLHNKLASKTVVSKVKTTQTQAKMASKAVMAEIECASTGVQVEMQTESENKKEKDVGDTKESNPLPKKQNRRTRKSVLQSYRSSEPEKDSEQTEETSGSESDQHSVKQMKKIPNDSKTGTNLAPSKAKQKRTTNTSRKSVQSKKKKTSDEEGGAFKLTGKEEEYPELPDNVGTGAQGDVPTEVQDDGPTEMHQEVPTGVQEEQPIENEAMDNEPADKSTKRVQKRTRNKEPCNVETINAKKAKASSKTTAKDESRTRKLSDEKHNNSDKTGLGTMDDENNALLSGEKQEKPSSVNKNLSIDDKKQRKTSEQILKERIGQAPVKSCTANGISQSKYPCPRPSINDKTRQSSIAEMSSILNGTKRQRTLYNTKDSSLMVSFLPVQESFMNSTTSRGNKPNGTMPPSLSEFMRSFIAPKLKKKPTS